MKTDIFSTAAQTNNGPGAARLFFPPWVAAIGLLALALPSLRATPSYSVSGQVIAGNVGVNSIQSAGPSAVPVAISDSITNPGWGSAAYTGSAAGTGVTVAGVANATEVVGDGLGTTGLGEFTFGGTLTDSMTFHSGTGDPVAVRFTLLLDDALWTSSPGDAKAQLNASFFPVSNTYYFNSGLSDYDSIGDGFGPSTVNASGLYYIPDGFSINFGIGLSVLAGAHFGTDYSIPTDPTFATQIRVNGSTAHLGLEILTPGGTYTSGSGTDYTIPSPTPSVPDATSTLALLGLGLGGLGFARRQFRWVQAV